jgi:phage tail tape-measure protein
MDTTEKDIRSLFANTGELDRDEVALLLLQLVERIQNLENAQQRTWVGLINEDWNSTAYDTEFRAGAEWAEDKLKEKNT